MGHSSWLILPEIAPNMCFSEAKFQNFPGEHAPGPPLVYSRLQRSILSQPEQLWTDSTGRVVMLKMAKSAKLKLIKR